MERGNLRKSVNGLFICGMSPTVNLVQKISDQFGNSQRSFLSPTECVKSIPPNTEKWLRKLYDKNCNNDTSNEDKHETNYSMNNDTMAMTMTANGGVQTREEATIYVKELDVFVTVMFLEETLAVLSLGKLCEDNGYTFQCKEFSSYYRKLATKTVRIQHEQQHEH